MTLHDELLKEAEEKRAATKQPESSGETIVIDGEGLDKLANALVALSNAPDDLDKETETALQSIVTEHERKVA